MKTFILCCLLAVATGNGYVPQPAQPVSYGPPALPPPPSYSAPAQPLPLPQGYVVAPPRPIVYTPAMPTTTTFLIHNAPTPPPKPMMFPLSIPSMLGSGAGGHRYGK